MMFAFQIGVSHQMSNVSIYVVDLRRVNPMGSPVRAKPGVSLSTGFKTGQHVRRSFVREKPGEK